MPINTKAYIEAYLQIRTKEAKVEALHLNMPQLKLYDALGAQHKAGKPMRAIVLKARQMGFSTLTEAMIFKRTVTGRNVHSGIVAHKDDSTNNLFNMSKLFYERLPDPLKPSRKASNARELVFDDANGGGLKSSIKVMTAGGQGIGRSDTFHNLHLSEFAFWPGDKKMTLAGLMQAVPDLPQTMVVIESTANGFDEFKSMWDRAVAGESEFVPVFCGWHEMREYRRHYDGFVFTDEEAQLAAAYGLDEEQLAWRRWCVENNCGGDVQIFKQEYPSCPEEAFLSTGSCIFDKDLLMAQLARVSAPKRRVDFMFSETADGGLCLLGAQDVKTGGSAIYKEPMAGVPYVIGADTAGDGSDFFVAQVLDNTTGEQVAVLRQKFDEDAFARQVMCLGYYYNTALLGIETNFSSYPTKECTRLLYPRQYMREVQDSYTQRIEHKFGFLTTGKTRPVAIAELVKAARESPSGICDAQTLREMLVFVRDERGRAAAMVGENDDCVMALAIAHMIRPQQTYLQEAVSVRDEGEGPGYDNQIADFLDFGG